MALKRDIVITGVGVVSPIGIGKEDFWNSLVEGCSGVRRVALYGGGGEPPGDLPTAIGGQVMGFDPTQYVRPRKSLKVMNRDIQFAFAAADLACADAALRKDAVDPERLGVLFGADLMPCDFSEMIQAYRGCMVDGRFDFGRWGQIAMEELFPLWMLKYLPNMPACHIGIFQDARGPNNSITLGEVSSLAALAEATRVIERGHADVMIAGGTGSRLHPAMWYRNKVFDLARYDNDPAAVPRPFDARREGMVSGEGAGAFILETRQRAQARGATVLARVIGYAATFEPRRNGQPPQGVAIRKAITAALRDAALTPADIGHVNAHGIGAVEDDRIEARAIHGVLGDVPVTAPKSFFGNLGAGCGAVETAVSVLALQRATVPHTRNYACPDPMCPVNVIRDRPLKTDKPAALVLNHTIFGQTIAIVLGAP
jgi:3-oxoacyl-[acyl-carrier-protein] synthase II